MRRDRAALRMAVVLAVTASTTPRASAQATAPSPSPVKKTGDMIQSSYAAHKGEFDYLLGDWEFTATSKQYGEFHGLWSAVRLDKGQILDEYRVTGDQGETYYVTTTLRNYNGALERWELVGADGGTGLQDFGTGHWDGREMRIEQTFGVAAGTPSQWRIRYHDIRADRFSWAADRSTDGGQTWVTDFQTIQARRIGPSRSIPPLTTVKPAPKASP
jgi:hypothetical protein